MPNAKPGKLSDLTPDSHNANKGTQRGLRMLDHSLREYGAGRSIVTDKNGVILAGNKTVERCADIGLDNTIVKDAGNTATGMIHPSENRRLTIPEIARIASYPDEFQFIGKYKERWARIGNSVPPVFMRSIALYIRKTILIENDSQ